MSTSGSRSASVRSRLCPPSLPPSPPRPPPRMPDLKSFSLEGRVVLQFGGSGLLGRALVTALADAGATLVVASRNPEVLTADAETAKAAGRHVHLEKVNLLDEASIQSLVERVAREYGPLHGMVYNAVTRTMSGFGDSITKWEESMRVNATG